MDTIQSAKSVQKQTNITSTDRDYPARIQIILEYESHNGARIYRFHKEYAG